MAINQALIDETFERIEQPDVEWDQRKAALCFAGHALQLHGYTFTKLHEQAGGRWVPVTPNGETLVHLERMPSPLGPILCSPSFVRACDLFGFDNRAGVDIFDCTWVTDVDVMRTRVGQAVENQLAREAGGPAPHHVFAGDSIRYPFTPDKDKL